MPTAHADEDWTPGTGGSAAAKRIAGLVDESFHLGFHIMFWRCLCTWLTSLLVLVLLGSAPLLAQQKPAHIDGSHDPLILVRLVNVRTHISVQYVVSKPLQGLV